uniref:Uncharacterized protein n=1 Tax=Rhizophora mucronata TaxID=61149 RepID=A0A2P2PWA9_RHIMU
MRRTGRRIRMVRTHDVPGPLRQGKIHGPAVAKMRYERGARRIRE